MTTTQLRKELTTLKIHVDQLDAWAKQATDIIYQIEEQIMDIEDKEWFDKYIQPLQMGV